MVHCAAPTRSGQRNQGIQMSDTVLVDEDEALESLCGQLTSCASVAVDTEFVRERTYNAQLCLIQLRGGDRLALVDPLAGVDLGPLKALLVDPDVEKVIHAARQDLEVLSQVMGTVPEPVFDTQVAAALTGNGDQVGYAALVKDLLGVELPKGETRTDWSRRPLTRQQLDYALDDVRYLPELRAKLGETLTTMGRGAWMDEEMAALREPSLYRVEPAEAWRRIRYRWPLSERSQAALVALAGWREEQAIRSDRPRGWIMKDDVLLTLATDLPTDADALDTLDALPPGTVKRHGAALTALIVDAIEGVPDTPAPPPDPRDPEREALAKSLMKRVRARASELGISAPMLATRRDIESLVRGETEIGLLRGWRREVIGSALLERIADT